MRIGHITPLIAKRYTNEATRKRAMFIVGKSGIGKSECVYQASELLSQYVDGWRGVIDLRLSQMEPTDLKGIPVPDHETGQTHMFRPDTLPQTGAGILFLDEITSAPPSIQAAAYEMALTPDHYGIPAGWMVVAAGNLQSDRGITFQMAGPLVNRFNKITAVATLDDFLNHAIVKGVRPEVTSYLKTRADHLHKFEGTGVIDSFASPRSWFALSDSMELDLAPADRVESFTGDVGHEVAVSFEAHLRVWESMPSMNDILAGKDVPLPEKMDVRYCIAMGLASRLDEKNFDGAWNFLQKMPKDIQTLTVKLAYRRCKQLVGSSSFTQWAAKNADAFKRG
jgi:ribosome modulation factor